MTNRIRISWLVVVWLTTLVLIVAAFVLAQVQGLTDLTKWAQALLFLIPACFVTISSFSVYKRFSLHIPEKKTWTYLTISGFSLVLAEVFRLLEHTTPQLSQNNTIVMISNILIFVCFIFLIIGFWIQQENISTPLGTNVRVLLLILIGVFAVVLAIGFAKPMFASDLNTLPKIFMLVFLVGDLLMFSGALALSIRMWGGTLAKPWIVWSFGTLVLVGYHLYTTLMILNVSGASIVNEWTGTILAIGLGVLATAAEMRRSFQE